MLGVGAVAVLALWGKSKRLTLRAVAAAIVGALLLVAVAGRPLLARASSTAFELADRLNVYRGTLAAIGDRPLLGHGAGTFAAMFPIYRPAPLTPDLSWYTAHDVYLEVAVGAGVPAFVLGLAMVAAMVWVMLRALARRKGALPCTMAALGAAVLVAAHSLLDFSLEIQGVALPFAILFGAGFGEALSVRPSEVAATSDVAIGARAPQAARFRLSLILAGVLSALLILGVVRLAVLAWGTPTSFWVGEGQALVSEDADFSTKEIARSESAYRYVKSLAFFPARYGDCARWPDATRTVDRCLELLDDALAHSPAASELWIEKARLSLLSGRQTEVQTALLNSHATAPREGWLAFRRARLLLSTQMSLSESLEETLRDDVNVVLRSRKLSTALAWYFATDAVSRSNLLPLLEESPNTNGVLQFIGLVRRQAYKN